MKGLSALMSILYEKTVPPASSNCVSKRMKTLITRSSTETAVKQEVSPNMSMVSEWTANGSIATTRREETILLQLLSAQHPQR